MGRWSHGPAAWVDVTICDVELFDRLLKPAPSPVLAPRLIWLENEFAIYEIAQGSTGWLRGCPHARFWHQEGGTCVSAWPIRLAWGLWWMKEPRPDPSTRDELASALRQQPPGDLESWAVGSLVDPDHKSIAKVGGPRVDTPGPILEVGTRIVAGRFQPDGCDGFDSQLMTVASGPWSGTLVDVRVGRAGAPYLIARLGIVPVDEPIAIDHTAADDLLARLRDVERRIPS